MPEILILIILSQFGSLTTSKDFLNNFAQPKVSETFALLTKNVVPHQVCQILDQGKMYWFIHFSIMDFLNNFAPPNSYSNDGYASCLANNGYFDLKDRLLKDFCNT